MFLHRLSRLALLLGTLALLFVAGCAPPPRPGQGGAPPPGGCTFTVWMLSDIQPPTRAERIRFERAIADVKALGMRIDMAVIAGDLLKGRSGDEAFAWFLAARAEAPVARWYEIAGNHDRRSAANFDRYFSRPPAYGVRFGNALMLLLSDTLPSAATEISDASFQWWRRMVLDNDDSILLTVSHGQLQGSGLLGSMFASRVIVDSGRFEEVLRQRPVSLWASGHSQLAHRLPGTFSCREELGGTCFINVSAIDAGLFGASESRLLIFSEGSTRLTIRSRDHDRGRFNDDLELVVDLPRPFLYPFGEPEVLPGP